MPISFKSLHLMIAPMLMVSCERGILNSELKDIEMKVVGDNSLLSEIYQIRVYAKKEDEKLKWKMQLAPDYNQPVKYEKIRKLMVGYNSEDSRIGSFRFFANARYTLKFLDKDGFEILEAKLGDGSVLAGTTEKPEEHKFPGVKPKEAEGTSQNIEYYGEIKSTNGVLEKVESVSVSYSLSDELSEILRMIHSNK